VSSFEKAARKIRQMVQYHRTTAAANESGDASRVQVRVWDNQIIDLVPMPSVYGFQSSAPVGTDVVTLSHNGELSNPIIVASNHIPSRMANLPTGGSRMHDNSGQQILMQNDNAITAVANASMTITAPEVFTSGNLHAGTGASGSFTTPTGQIVTVRDGIITNIF
jgi:phage gp45-like